MMETKVHEARRITASRMAYMLAKRNISQSSLTDSGMAGKERLKLVFTTALEIEKEKFKTFLTF